MERYFINQGGTLAAVEVMGEPSSPTRGGYTNWHKMTAETMRVAASRLPEGMLELRQSPSAPSTQEMLDCEDALAYEVYAIDPRRSDERVQIDGIFLPDRQDVRDTYRAWFKSANEVQQMNVYGHEALRLWWD